MFRQEPKVLGITQIAPLEKLSTNFKIVTKNKHKDS